MGRPNAAEARGYTCEPLDRHGITHDTWRAEAVPALSESHRILRAGLLGETTP